MTSISEQIATQKKKLIKVYQKEAKLGHLKTFSIKGFPSFEYVETHDSYVVVRLGCGFNPKKEKLFVNKNYPDKNLIFVSAALPKNFRKIVAMHEYAEGISGIHQQGLEAEKSLAKILGEQERWKQLRLAFSRRGFRNNYMVRRKFVGEINKEYHNREQKHFRQEISENAKGMGLKISEFKKGVKDILNAKRTIHKRRFM